MIGFGQGRGGAGRPAGARGVPGSTVCRCPSCGHTEPHARGIPCFTKRCPKCGTRMLGSNC